MDRRRHRVLVVDDRALVAQSLAASLSGRRWHVDVLPEPLLGDAVPIVGPGTGCALVAAALGPAAPALIRELTFSSWRVLLLAHADDRLGVAAALDAGASGWVSVTDELAELSGAIEAVFGGVVDLVDPNERTALAIELRRHRTTSARALAPFERLTPREREVLAGLVEGMRADDIAASSFVSVTTVRNQIQSVLTKLDARSQLDAVARARRAGWSLEGRAG
ncbi:MAG TPA: LuxR C-terminal-related transcriptional regulator [Acidimicrobiia bacterium]|nr:LuxR C-terminal-related transcriptional regulator [Acidimicrobiia bacterium]